MPTIRTIIRTGFLSLTIAITPLSLPLVTYADDGGTCSAPTATEPGNRTPSGSAAKTYHYNCASHLWENDHYTYSPDTQDYTAKDPTVYTYNSASKQYDYSVWNYSPVKDAYYEVFAAVTTPPTGAEVVGGPAPVSTSNAPNAVSGPGSTTTGMSGTSATGPDSSNASNLDATSNTTINNTSNAGLNNTIAGTATSGNALVMGNTSGGDAASGNVQDIANIVNMLQSSSNMLGTGKLATFVANIDGDVNGDLLFDPATIGSIQNASGNSDITSNTVINNSSDAAINNTVTLAADSGDASVSRNTNGGNATSGNATAIANIVNTINSAITSGQSFLGVININGNLNGDILLPPDFIDQLIASNVPTVTITAPDSFNANNTTVSDTTAVSNTNNQGISNNVTATADSGNAAVANNTGAGSATSGAAKTHITAFNLTGSNVVGANNLLVFVNVLGTWVGLIVNAPSGATAASLGGDITENTTTIDNNTAVTNTVNQKINNNVNVASSSGDAKVNDNTKAGNARSGDASSAVNLLNIEDSKLNFSNWFGLLFINVFGSWNGSFGMDTAAGNVKTTTSAPIAPTTALAANAPQVFRFVANSDAAPTASASSNYQAVPVNNSVVPANIQDAAVLAAQTKKTAASITADQFQGNRNSLWKAGSAIGGIVALYIIADAFLTRYRAQHRIR